MDGVTTEQDKSESPLLYRVEDGIAYLTLNRPGNLNAFSGDLVQLVNAAFVDFKADDDARVMVINAAGDRAFSAGFDILDGDKALAAEGEGAVSAYEFHFVRDDLNGKPVVAAIQGHCIGLGVALALAADIRVGGTNAKFAVPEARIGISAVQLPALLVERIGYAHANYFMLTAGPVDADWALRSGLLHEVMDPALIYDRAVEIARGLASQAPLALSAHKKLLRVGTPSKSDDVMALGLAERKKTLNSADFVEGRKAFIENRAPKFQGR